MDWIRCDCFKVCLAKGFFRTSYMKRGKMMRLSGSILAVKSNYFEYAQMLKYANVDCLHIDIFQEGGEFLLEEVLKFDDTYLPLDVHLIFGRISENDIRILNEVNVKYLSIQYETLQEKECIKKVSKLFKGNFGIAITAQTSLMVVEKNINQISHVLFMCSEPGVSGAKFDESNFSRIEMLHNKYPSLELYADGGINDVIGEKMGKLGVSMVVSGSYLCRDYKQLGANAYTLKYLNEQNVNVCRKMIKINSLPLLTEDAIFIQIINTMNHYRMGIVLIVEEDYLKGIITDGDIRRAFIKFGENIFKKVANDIMNSEPFVVNSENKMEDIFEKLSIMRKGIDVVPVVEGGKLIGAIDLKMGI